MTRNIPKITNLLMLAFLFVACDTNKIKKITMPTMRLSPTGYLTWVKKSKRQIDSLAKDTSKLLVFTKVPNNNALVRVTGNNFPEEIETTLIY